MEKQTIGSFLATLRKANGYTQQEVAEKLGVSNKTLSSWETDKTCPDLTLVPVLADLYGVTSDEILRAERKKTEEFAAEADKKDGLTAKNVRAVLKRQSLKFKNYNYILRGVSVSVWVLLLAGILFYMYVNNLTAIIFATLFVCGIIVLSVLQHVCSENALAFADENVEETWETVFAYKRSIFSEQYKTSLFMVAPLLIVFFVYPVVCFFLSFNFNAMVWFGVVSAAAELLGFLIWRLIYGRYRRKAKKYLVSEKNKTAFADNGKLLKKCTAGGGIGWLAVTFFFALTATLPPFFTISTTVYSTSDKSEFTRHIQSIEFTQNDFPVRLGNVPEGEYYFDIQDAVKEILFYQAGKHRVDLKDGFFLEGASDWSGGFADETAKKYAISLYWEEVLPTHVSHAYYVKDGLVYLSELDVFMLRYDYSTVKSGYDYLVKEKKGVYSVCLKDDYAKYFFRAALLFQAFPAPAALVIYALKRRSHGV